MEVTSTETGVVRLFSVDLSPQDVAAFNTRAQDVDDPGWPLCEALGATYLDEDFIEYFDVSTLEGVGLTGYMTEGLGIAEAEVKQDAVRLSAISGQLLIVFSSAFDGVAQTLTPRAPLRWIGTYREDKAPVAFAPLPSQAAKGVIAPTAPVSANPHVTVLVAMLALPMLVAILVIVFVLLRG